MEDRLLNVCDAAEYLGIHRSTLDHWRVEKPIRGPAFTRVGHQVRYRKSDLERYLNERMVAAE